MKNFYSSIFLLFIVFSSTAQIVTIPDANFKNALINANCATIGSDEELTDADSNNDGEIQESEALVVTSLRLYNQNISDLTGIESFSNLEGMDCSNNSLTTLNLNNFLSLGYLLCSNNNMTSLSLSNCFNLYRFDCDNNLMTSIDLSSTRVYKVYIRNNPNLTYINLKNGFITDGYYSFKTAAIPPPPPSDISGNSNLINVCCDDDETDYLINHGHFGSPIDPTINVNSYCSSMPGGSFNTITGTVKLDCSGANVPLNHQKISFTSGTQSAYTFTNNGNYTFYTSPNAITVAPNLYNAAYFTFEPSNYVFNFTGNATTETANFCFTSNGSRPDLEVTIIPHLRARPGFLSLYQIVYKNKGNLLQSGTVTFSYNDDILNLVSSNPTISSLADNTLTWDFSNLTPGETRYINVYLNVNSPTDTPPVNIGDALQYQAVVSSPLADQTPADNTMYYNQTVVGSFDPNDKEVVEGSVIDIDQIDDYLHYIIRFQNTGNAEAENVAIKDMLDGNLDWSTLEMVSSSHTYRSTLTSGNKLEVFYQGINLPASSVNEVASQGYIAFKIKPKSTIMIGDEILNTANIYFDFNFPIVTNTVTTTVNALGVPSFSDELFRLYPNPATTILNISVSDNTTIKKVIIANALGQTIMTFENNTLLYIASLTKGIYFVTVETESGTETQRMIKQ
jgi:uncharacterized repeat protein (TIGR01451 family)